MYTIHHFKCIALCYFSIDVTPEMQDEIDFTKPWDHSDITFIVEDQKVYANKMILSMTSPVMKAMFESDSKEIELPCKELKPFLDLMRALHPPSHMKGN